MSDVRLARPIEPVRLPESREELIEWGAEHGFDVPTRGPVPQEVSDRYIGYRLRARRRLITQGRI